MQDPTLFNVAQQIGMRATAQRWLSGWVGPVKFWPETTNNCSAEICATLAGLLSGSIPTAKKTPSNLHGARSDSQYDYLPVRMGVLIPPLLAKPSETMGAANGD
ncbi:hypothetical protein LAC81_26130 [Ensifer adhaerens]|uniref:hypothetical protein n=1 Tax=Ensifer adhaerens TaxID=106592 RepID=UPI001CBAF8B8|nr:hypothetical protein [Ensifer adhaerens]MBZ7924204.1 hypothetical protein [Ensifer adhaerens]UAX96540.1 hypothetical protein LAC78_22355 [Ensifer adhaerens]UAY04116.1 hypothetical protein LAC80_22605 [Ensifer adhaerens]UAY12102.1 hypothetical protein LAC81_26130 [Ensifer adhaerens]